MLVGTTPPKAAVIAAAREGVETFVTRYGGSGKRETGDGRRET